MSPFMLATSPVVTTRRFRHWSHSCRPTRSSSVPSTYLIEQLGFRKIVDATFMMAAMVPYHVEIAAVRRHFSFSALRRAQADIDMLLQPYVQYCADELPERGPCRPSA